MKNSTIVKKLHNFLSIKIFIILFWIGLWQIIAMIINNEVIVARPYRVIETFFNLVIRADFWQTIFNTSFKIISGFLLAIFIAGILAFGSHRFRLIKELFSPLINFLKSVPVVSFIIILLVSIQSKSNLSLIIAFMMVLPIMYTNILSGLENINKGLLDMAKIFNIHKRNKLIYIYLSNILPFLISGAKIALGLCWKSGIAAEVIGQINQTIGNKLYYAKLYLNIHEVFVWTIVIILISIVFEKIFLSSILYLKKKVER